MSGPIKRSVTLAGHRTSISLEPVFWDLLEKEAERQGLSINQFVLQIDENRSSNLSSAIRTHLVEALLDTRQNDDTP
jgi:predicted DNA-binding ribbon-helix-helix protein